MDFNDYLAKRLGWTKRPPRVIPNALDERLWEAVTAKNVTPVGPIRILCMGTLTHNADFAIIEPALIRLKEEFKDHVTIDVIGMTTSSITAAGINQPSIPKQAFRSYPAFVNWIVRQPAWDVGLAPLRDTKFNRCKSPIKALDFRGTHFDGVGVADVSVYRGSIADGPAGTW